MLGYIEVMEKLPNIPKAEQLTLAESAVQMGLQKLDLAAGLVLGALSGAIEGGKQGLAAMRAFHEERAENLAQIENFANDSVQHDQ
jgi:hypothetical protein